MNIVPTTKRFILENDLLAYGDTVVVGVSGGGDSTALLRVLHALRHEFGLNLICAHYNHKARKSADTDQRFVERLAGSLEIQCVSDQHKGPGKKLTEQRARNDRFRFLLNLARRQRADAIALGHTQDDLAETVLMRILRGTGAQGLRAIMPKRSMQGTTLIRPFLHLKRNDVAGYLEKHGFSYRRDPTNTQKRFFRNKVRHTLLPLLEKEFNPNAKKMLANLSSAVTQDYDFLEDQACAALKKLVGDTEQNGPLKLDLLALKRKHPALRRMIVRKAVAKVMGNTNALTLDHSRKVEQLLSNPKANVSLQLPRGLRISKNKDRLVVSTK